MEPTKIRDYVIIDKIGEGGMGDVYLAKDNLERKVAIKVLNPILAKDEHLVKRFKQEARAQSALSHPNIVTLYNYFVEDDKYCIAMEYAEGETLKSLIKRIGPIPEARSKNILKQILEGLNYAHSKGIIHRDIKPSNIIIDKNDNVKIMDFGIAKILGDRNLTKTGTKLGTIFYMSPEQVLGHKDVDHRSDIYSLGVTFFEMLSGKLPFDSTDASDFILMQNITDGPIKDPRDYYPHISEKTVNLLFEMLIKDRAQRIQECSECLSNLDDNTERPQIIRTVPVPKIIREYIGEEPINNSKFIFSYLFMIFLYFIIYLSPYLINFFIPKEGAASIYSQLKDPLYFQKALLNTNILCFFQLIFFGRFKQLRNINSAFIFMTLSFVLIKIVPDYLDKLYDPISLPFNIGLSLIPPLVILISVKMRPFVLFMLNLPLYFLLGGFGIKIWASASGKAAATLNSIMAAFAFIFIISLTIGFAQTQALLLSKNNKY
ncbi:MAG: serine/threonine-protein kinase [Bacteroidota bacterium]|nr:serine/threonine-protein kinase [Bacteroidota bacterium]